MLHKPGKGSALVDRHISISLTSDGDCDPSVAQIWGDVGVDDADPLEQVVVKGRIRFNGVTPVYYVGELGPDDVTNTLLPLGALPRPGVSGGGSATTVVAVPSEGGCAPRGRGRRAVMKR